MLAKLRQNVIATAQTALASAYSRRLDDHPQLVRALALTNGSGRSGPAETGVSESDYVALFETVLERKPKHILELGAGRSSAVIAAAQRQIGECSFVAIEESPDWHKSHLALMPKDLGPRVELIQRDVALQTVDGVRCVRYVDVPIRPYELVHVDGPALAVNDVSVSCDVIDLLPHLSERCLITFDGRESSSRLARPHLERAGFRFKRHPFTLAHRYVRN